MEHIIEIKNLTKKYAKAKVNSVDDISFIVDEGEFLAFLGPNGAGKTTTISILTTTLSMTSGVVKIAGYDLEKEAKKVRENVGIIFQNPSLDQTLSAEENIRFHACLYGLYTYKPTFKMMDKEYQKTVIELAKIVGIEDSLFKAVKNLSGGMKRKLEIIRSLIHKPKVLFLDEPTQGLDANSRRSLWKYLDDIRKKYKITVFLTTHYIDEAEMCDRVCVINHGKIIALDSPDDLKAQLLKQEIILDSDDQEELKQELKNMNLDYKEDNHLIVDCAKTSYQEIISKIKTKLTVLKINEPSLEDAYVELLNTRGDEDNG